VDHDNTVRGCELSAVSPDCFVQRCILGYFGGGSNGLKPSAVEVMEVDGRTQLMEVVLGCLGQSVVEAAWQG